MTAGDDEDGGDADSSSWPEYCSLSDRMVTPDSTMGFGGSSDAMARLGVCTGGLLVGCRSLTLRFQGCKAHCTA